MEEEIKHLLKRVNDVRELVQLCDEIIPQLSDSNLEEFNNTINLIVNHNNYKSGDRMEYFIEIFRLLRDNEIKQYIFGKVCRVILSTSIKKIPPLCIVRGLISDEMIDLLSSEYEYSVSYIRCCAVIRVAVENNILVSSKGYYTHRSIELILGFMCEMDMFHRSDYVNRGSHMREMFDCNLSLKPQYVVKYAEYKVEYVKNRVAILATNLLTVLRGGGQLC
jgi:hypothetical protein